METVKQMELWSNLGSHGHYLLTLVDTCVFSLALKPGIMKFWIEVEFNLEGNDKSTPQTMGFLTNVHVLRTSGGNLVILAWRGDEIFCGLFQNWVNLDFILNLTLKVLVNRPTKQERS